MKYSAESEPAWTKSTHSYFPVIPAHNIYHQDHADGNVVMMMVMVVMKMMMVVVVVVMMLEVMIIVILFITSQ